MTTKLDIAPSSDRELVLARIIDAPRENVYRCWTEPKLVTHWFAPKPWTTPRAEMDVRTGGSSLVVMAGPTATNSRTPGSSSKSCRAKRSFSPTPIQRPGSLPKSRS
ncbi:Activator of Hsp90 ATPase homolog 1-like protein [Mesorhizobium muleiense]|uniref:Activator of Hsp90 ATPase homolog 1-like protein n=1 Tax=Mesorhizobium muleiense TaxID=1004279 RepID=A0A1G8M052_9HYPH|nr:Activator of Hsp90 ATPase homolog 1-like protein [Mesorhizobium muleiense]